MGDDGWVCRQMGWGKGLMVDERIGGGSERVIQD